MPVLARYATSERAERADVAGAATQFARIRQDAWLKETGLLPFDVFQFS